MPVMMTAETRKYINRGCTVRISMGGQSWSGVVNTAINYGTAEEPNWYVELLSPEHGAMYLKQIPDGFADAIIVFGAG